jgi:endonuclease/exonuclease/phosphatase (EEP) superfamily protein YafD
VRILRRIAAATSWFYAALVAVAWLALRFVGEGWWLTTLALYMPRVVLLAPAAALALLHALGGPRRLVLLQAGTAGMVLFPVMGLKLAGPNAATPGAPQLRVLSFNVDSGRNSVPDIVAEILGARADVVLLQESAKRVDDAVAAALTGFATRTSGQFFFASRYPIADVYEPPKVKFRGVQRSPRFVRATIETPLGRLDVYNVHLISPRDPLEDVRGEGFIVGLRSGAVFRVDRRVIAGNAELRRSQAELVASFAAASPNPVIIAGDTNLPDPSRILAETLGRWQDGFAAAGRGFGYTFPVGRRFAWMRIDRILAGPELRFLGFEVGAGRGSDHHCVWAEVERLRSQ